MNKQLLLLLTSSFFVGCYAMAPGVDTEVVCSPQSNLYRRFEQLIDWTYQDATNLKVPGVIKVACECFSDKGLADKLIAAAKAGVKVSLLLDAESELTEKRFEDQPNISVTVFSDPRNKDYMSTKAYRQHEKIGIFANNALEERLVVLGSFNWIKRDNDHLNFDSITIDNDAALVDAFDEEFGKLKNRAAELDRELLAKLQTRVERHDDLSKAFDKLGIDYKKPEKKPMKYTGASTKATRRK